LSTAVLPQIKAGAILRAGIAIGTFQGVINAQTPTGSRRSWTSTSGRLEGRMRPLSS
jgi:ATP-dependent helicase YprA (DUF1998 family)